MQRGGLSSDNVDKAIREQLILGAVESDMMLLQLGSRKRKTRPPTFLGLLKEIREAEEIKPVDVRSKLLQSPYTSKMRKRYVQHLYVSSKPTCRN